MTTPDPTHTSAAKSAAIKKEREPRPLTEKLMKRVNRIINASEKTEGTITRRSFAADIGKGYNEVIEWLGSWRSAPNSETTLRIILWGMKNDPEFMDFLIKEPAYLRLAREAAAERAAVR